MKLTNILVLIIGLTATLTLSAQKGIEIGGRIGAAHYFGDLNPDYNPTDLGLAIGFTFRRNFNERVSTTLGIDYGRVSGSDSNSNNQFELKRNLDFRSNVVDISGTFEFNFFPYIHGSDDNFYTPYVFIGLSMMRFNPQTDYNGLTYDLRDQGTEGQTGNSQYFLLAASWAYGIGFKWDYNRDWSFNITLSGRRTSTDYLDDVSQDFPDYSRLSPIGVALSNRSDDPDFGLPSTQRGNSDTNDQVYFLSIGVLRYFGQLHCPPITKDLY